MNAQQYADSIESPVVFIAGNGCPAGQNIALLSDTFLPFELIDIEGDVANGILTATNLNTAMPTDWNGNAIYKVQVYDRDSSGRCQNQFVILANRLCGNLARTSHLQEVFGGRSPESMSRSVAVLWFRTKAEHAVGVTAEDSSRYQA